MVIEEDQPPIYVDPNKFSYNVINNSDPEKIGNTSDTLLLGLLINIDSEFSILEKCIHLHNTALAVPDLKSGFLNLWTSMEVLFQSKEDGNKFEHVMKNIVPILRKNYISNIIEDIKINLQKNLSDEEYTKILNLIDGDISEDKKLFYLFLLSKHRQKLKIIYEILADYPVLRSRISQLSELNTAKELKKYIEKYVQRITWHLYRIYRTRNLIIHSGEVPYNIKNLGEHLHSYVDTTMLEFVMKLSGDTPFDSISNVVVDIRFVNKELDSILDDGHELKEENIDVLMHPYIYFSQDYTYMEQEPHLNED